MTLFYSFLKSNSTSAYQLTKTNQKKRKEFWKEKLWIKHFKMKTYLPVVGLKQGQQTDLWNRQRPETGSQPRQQAVAGLAVCESEPGTGRVSVWPAASPVHSTLGPGSWFVLVRCWLDRVDQEGYSREAALLEPVGRDSCWRCSSPSLGCCWWL